MEAAVRHLLATSFAGTECVAVFSLEEATNALRAQHFDLILLDIAVPGCDRIGIIHIFRMLQPRIPVLVFTRLDENVYALPFIRSRQRFSRQERAGERDYPRADARAFAPACLRESVDSGKGIDTL
ncbi:MAG: response regulator [Siphonobacter aquaeclarae]|nr:response regulator [Siphonobacter aquaeclarae]